MYRCCIFDLDGTLLDTLKSLQNSVNATIAHFGFEPIDGDHIKQFVGDGYKKLVERSLIYCGDGELVHYEEALELYMKEFSVHVMDEVGPYPGIPELLEYLKGEQVKIAVLSNKPHEKTLHNIAEIFGADYFDYAAGEREGILRKPDPAGVYMIMEELGVGAEECLYVGDTGTDMETGRNAGVDTIGVLWGFRDEQELGSYHPQYLVREPLEISQIVEQSKKNAVENQ